MIGKLFEFLVSLTLILWLVYVCIMLFVIVNVGLFVAARFLLGLL